MRLVKYTHACVRLERDGAVLVIDPGTFSEREALAGASAVLVTHEHYDHLDPDAPVRVLLVPVAAPWLKIAESIELVHAVKPELAVPIHDALLSEPGVAAADNWVRNQGGAEYRRLAPGEGIDL